MICREHDGTFVMIKQHDHGLLSGELAKRFRSEQVPEPARRAEVLRAVSNHDRGWIDLDETPFWNDAERAPYTFIDFPVVPKLTFYTKGLDEIESDTPYGALLCSLHFERLIEVSGEDNPELTEYLEQEEERRTRIRRELEQSAPIGEAELFYDTRLLQFCDDLSLYMALNEPGSPKSEEHPWWKDGFSGSEDFGFTEGCVITAEWKDKHTLKLNPFPFTESFEVVLPLRRMPKAEVEAKGIARAYRDTPQQEFTIVITDTEGNV
ncbi:DUF3891 family protein [Paenibacillus wynnii]|uniref:Uncharacterized protein n=1 Tax=Paenibacillus wynnii TaxID=268407 RepID=A0A098MGT8_9BACL|nr:DUF3891 family protein [Paenibacillus wynnii]KGE20757.1 hypothetical protein PWYN_00835 [Paenibacillus wynnii]